MSLGIDVTFIHRASSRLKLFKATSKKVFTCRCPICGDSKKDELKTRFYFYPGRHGYMTKCHNCGYSRSFYKFLEDFDSSLFKEYKFDKFKDQTSTRFHTPYQAIKTEPEETISTGVDSVFELIKRVDKLTEHHYIHKYLDGRKIPLQVRNHLYYSADFNELLDVFGHNKLKENEPRLIIPFYDWDGGFLGLQGRTIGKHSVRYMTLKYKTNSPKAFGLERFAKDEKGYVVEGALDSLFLGNCIALSGLDSTIKDELDKEKTTFVLDNQPRHRDVVRNMEVLCKEGFKVCVWPKRIKNKDINKMIMGGLDVRNLKKIIDKNTHQGIDLKLAITDWSRV